MIGLNGLEFHLLAYCIWQIHWLSIIKCTCISIPNSSHPPPSDQIPLISKLQTAIPVYLCVMATSPRDWGEACCKHLNSDLVACILAIPHEKLEATFSSSSVSLVF